MIEVRTYKNHLISDPEKDGYCFKSNPNQTLSQAQLAREFREYNSSITEPDALSMLSILDTLVKKYVARGYSVELPFCYVYNKATGTTESIRNSFQPGAGNNRFQPVFELKPAAAKDMTADVNYKLLPPEIVTAPRLLEAYVLSADAQENRELNVLPGSSMRLRGSNIKANLADSEQGVFFVAQNKSQTRIASYTRNGTNVIDFSVPAEISSGTYSIMIVNKTESGIFQESKCADTVTVL